MEGGAQGPVPPGEGILTQNDLELPYSNQMLKFRENRAQNLTISGTNMSVEMIVNTGSIILSGSHIVVKITRNFGSVQNRGMKNLVEIESQEFGGNNIDYGIDSRIVVIGRPQPVPQPLIMINNPPHYRIHDRLDYPRYDRPPPGFEQAGEQTALDVQRALVADAQEIQRRALQRPRNEPGPDVWMNHGPEPHYPHGMIPAEHLDHRPNNVEQIRVGVEGGIPEDDHIEAAPVPVTPQRQMMARGTDQILPCDQVGNRHRINEPPQPPQDDGRPKGPDYFQAPKWLPHYKTEVGKRLERGIMTFKREIVEIEKLEFAQAQKELSKRYYVGTNAEEKLIVPHCRVCGEYSGRSDKGRLDCFVDCDKQHTYHLSCLEPWILHAARCPQCNQSLTLIKIFKAKDLPAGGTDGKKQTSPPL